MVLDQSYEVDNVAQLVEADLILVREVAEGEIEDVRLAGEGEVVSQECKVLHAFGNLTQPGHGQHVEGLLVKGFIGVLDHRN